LRQGLEAFEAEDEARVLVLTGAGGEAFCAGADLKAIDLDVDDPAGPLGISRLTPSKPTIAAVDGWCLAGGLELAEQIASFPQETMLADRRAAHEGLGLPLADGLELERRLGREVLPVAARGAARFAAGEGRHGKGV
jgi:enoyl-CoA hydratase